MSTREFFRRNLGPWACRMWRRVSIGVAFVLDSLLAGQAPDGVTLAEKR